MFTGYREVLLDNSMFHLLALLFVNAFSPTVQERSNFERNIEQNELSKNYATCDKPTETKPE